MKFFVTLFFWTSIFSTVHHHTVHKTWGQTGHRVVGDVAAHYLTPKARKAVNRVLDGESMAIASTWMDHIRSDSKWDYTHPWHWVTIPDGKTYTETKKNPDGDVIEATRRMIKALKKGGLSHIKEQQDLKMLIHMIGDIHQPLHVGNGKDRGGNDVKVHYMGESSNLHRVWDSDMIDQSQLSYSELAKAVDNITKRQVNNWQNSTIIDWANESKALRGKAYQLPSNHDIGYRYKYQHWNIVKKRLVQAGVRLAGVLNDIYG